MAKIGIVQEVAIDALRPYKNNAKMHGPEQLERLRASIQEFGFISPCLVDADMNIIAGHGRVMAAEQLGMKKVPCVFVEGLTETQRKAYILADNKLGELGEWNADAVAEELRWLSDEGFEIDLTGFEVEDQIIDAGPISDMGIGEQIEEMTRLKSPKSKLGQIYLLGTHRLMVGDSTNIDDVLKLMNGGHADLLITDPPYGVNVENALGDTIVNDDLAGEKLKAFLMSAFENANAVMKKGAAFYIWYASSNGREFYDALHEAGLTLKQVLVWVKNQFTLGRQDYQWKHEPCMYGWKEGAGHYFCEKRNISTIIKSRDYLESASREELVDMLLQLREYASVFEYDKPQISEYHPTMKPLELIERHIKNSSRKNDLVLDLFGGSGTTLLACEELGRKCNMMEYDPKYADVIIARWEEMTGKKALLISREED